MQRVPVDSSDLVSVGYDELSQTLEIEFKENRVYQYLEVPADIYKGLLKADSPGRYFFSYINAYFRYRKVEASNRFSFKDRNSVTLVTTNPRKLREAQRACAPWGITIKQQSFDIDEIQAHDPMKIAQHKAEEAFRRTGGAATVINDAFWSIPALKGFPGGYMKDVWQWFEAEDFLNLMHGKKDRTIIATDTVIYKDANQTKVFVKEVSCIVADQPRGKGNSIEQVVQMPGGKTIAELHESGEAVVLPEDDAWVAFAQWFSQRKTGKV